MSHPTEHWDKKDEGKFPIVNWEDENPYYTQIWFKCVGR
jgi:hypothetical protein